MKLEDALFNWLQIKIVAEARPDDRSALDTLEFFSGFIRDDHQVSHIEYSKDENMYLLRYTIGDTEKTQRYDAEMIESLLVAIQKEPKFNIEG